MKAAWVLALTVLSSSAFAGDQASRLARQAEIEYYTSRYDGADIALARFNCKPPNIPMRPATAGGPALTQALAAWHDCYDQFLANYNAALPVGKSIPADLADLMTDEEMGAAQALMSQVFVQVADEAKRQADAVTLAQSAWEGRQGDLALSARDLSHQPETAGKR
ncbi:hypothetical protein LPN04_21140 [Rugamonas sp. A1-17]|nr:hypothetical protein [Rugamonas sp. A1-17]